MKSWIVLAVILGFLLGACHIITGDGSHWPSSLAAIVFLVLVKIGNDRAKILAWPMEFLLASGVTMIVFSLVRLYFTPLPY